MNSLASSEVYQIRLRFGVATFPQINVNLNEPSGALKQPTFFPNSDSFSQ